MSNEKNCCDCRHYESEDDVYPCSVCRGTTSPYSPEYNQRPHMWESDDEDCVNHPSHYATGKFECIDVMCEAIGVDAVKDFCICNAFKYLYRHGKKNGIEDVKKAKWYLDKFIELTEPQEG